MGNSNVSRCSALAFELPLFVLLLISTYGGKCFAEVKMLLALFANLHCPLPGIRSVQWTKPKNTA